MNKRHNYRLDFLKFVFAMAVVLYHTDNVIKLKKPLLGSGNLAVEFFFIVSGCLMANSAVSLLLGLAIRFLSRLICVFWRNMVRRSAQPSLPKLTDQRIEKSDACRQRIFSVFTSKDVPASDLRVADGLHDQPGLVEQVVGITI